MNKKEEFKLPKWIERIGYAIGWLSGLIWFEVIRPLARPIERKQ